MFSQIKPVAERMQTDKQRVGTLGEDIACRYLCSRGYLILERNFRRKWGEIDVIAKHGGQLHFVEVKTVSHDFVESNAIDTYRPEENVHPRKLRRLARTVATYLAGRNDEPAWQFDVIAIFLDRIGKKARVRYLEDIILSY